MAATAKPRTSQITRTRSRHIPARVKRAVWLRDGGRCAFVAANGRRCTERVFLEFHHCEPYAIGGEATVTNVSLRCRAHNVYEAQLLFGPGAFATAMPLPAAPVVREAAVPYVARIVGAAPRRKTGRRKGNSPRGELSRDPPSCATPSRDLATCVIAWSATSAPWHRQIDKEHDSPDGCAC
jgi:hypothetical protein